MKKRTIAISFLFLLMLMLMLIFILSFAGCGKVNSSDDTDGKDVISDIPASLDWTMEEKSDVQFGYRITQLPFPLFWGGAAYSIVTPSGDLYLIDGGFQEKDSPKITEYINAHGGKVKGWILTHPHVDHIGAFLDYAAAFPDTIETVYYSPFTSEFFEDEKDPDTYQLLNNAILYYEFLQIMELTSSQIKYIPMSVGDILMLDDMKLECYHSFDPELKDINGNSLVFTLSLLDFTLLYTADMTEASLYAIQGIADENAGIWDVDVIQIPHHGYQGGITTEELYRLTGAGLALLDCTQEEFDNNSAGIQTTVQLVESLEIPVVTRFSSPEGNSIYLYPEEGVIE